MIFSIDLVNIDAKYIYNFPKNTKNLEEYISSRLNFIKIMR